MERFWKYMEDEPAGIRAIKYFLFWLITYELYLYIAFVDYIAEISFIGGKQIWQNFLSAAAEEMAFRSAPFILSETLFDEKKKKFRLAILFFWITISFVLFGLLHVFTGVSLLRSIIVQGVMGLVVGKIYLKCGGIKGKIIKPLIICVLFHLTHNIYVQSVIYAKIS